MRNVLSICTLILDECLLSDSFVIGTWDNEDLILECCNNLFIKQIVSKLDDDERRECQPILDNYEWLYATLTFRKQDEHYQLAQVQIENDIDKSYTCEPSMQFLEELHKKAFKDVYFSVCREISLSF